MADSPLQKYPLGLLELLAAKVNGQTPTLFAERLQPTVDLTEFYGADLVITGITQGAAAAFPLALTRVSEVTQRFHGLAAEVAVGAAAGTYLSIRLFVSVPNGSPNLCVAQTVITVPNGLVAGVAYNASFWFPTPLILPAGTGFIAYAQSDAAGVDHVMALRSIQNNIA